MQQLLMLVHFINADHVALSTAFLIANCSLQSKLKMYLIHLCSLIVTSIFDYFINYIYRLEAVKYSHGQILSSGKQLQKPKLSFNRHKLRYGIL